MERPRRPPPAPPGPGRPGSSRPSRCGGMRSMSWRPGKSSPPCSSPAPLLSACPPLLPRQGLPHPRPRHSRFHRPSCRAVSRPKPSRVKRVYSPVPSRVQNTLPWINRYPAGGFTDDPSLPSLRPDPCPQ